MSNYQSTASNFQYLVLRMVSILEFFCILYVSLLFFFNNFFLQAVFVGHNHGLDWCCPYKNLWLCFARHTGYGGYGNWPRGSRILEMTENPFSLKSWIRMEDGSEHSYVILSSWIACAFRCIPEVLEIQQDEAEATKFRGCRSCKYGK